MPIFKNKTEDSDGWLSILLALRLRQIESEYPDYASFADATGLSRGTLYQLRTGKGNPTFVTLERLARYLKVPVWSLIGIPGDEKNVKQAIETFGFSYDEIARHIEATRAVKRSMTEFSGVPTSHEDAGASGEASERKRISPAKKGTKISR
ncbi:helix-turn-helix transcriptional regulator (plasmid) [Rhizobium sp. CB3171]|uniref:helix-turn-helix domain-containing protein n=1 Tax=Rhizobium sp. CB3171 TaxID=3039157 RepID=UPI0024B1F17B|nr:helix-turn-helix transcriptional regulator [Rhizobium sp. CB3171]WFU07193.1 helix-turn-helix transcriptional regulator [Rhizobium sp. CB3171]